MKKTKHLPQDVLLDALVHLHPADIDGSLRFVSATYRSLVERRGSILPKHTVVLHQGSLPQPRVNLFTSREPGSSMLRSPNPTIGWVSFGDGDDDHVVSLDADGLNTLLASERLGRISHVSLAEWCNNQHGNTFLQVLRRCLEDGTALSKNFAICMEVHHPRQGFDFYYSAYFKYYPTPLYQIHRFTMDVDNAHVPATFAMHGREHPEHTVHLIYRIIPYTFYFGLIPFLELIHDSFTKARDQFHPLNHKGELLVYCHCGRCETLSLIMNGLFGRPEEASRRVGKWQLATAAPDGANGGDDHSLAAFRHYYRQLEGSEWRVWRVRNPHLRHAGGANDAAGGSSGSRGKYLRVMQMLREDSDLSWALHFKVFDGREGRKDGEDNEADID